jgi:hypothetical protein
MKVVFRQSGGFAGLIRGTELDAEDLPPEQVVALRSLVERNDLQGASGESTEARDLRTYELTVKTDEGVHRVAFDERNIPEGLAPLLDTLKERSGPRPLT